MSLFGLGKPKYSVVFNGFGFKSKKKRYKEGETVTVYYDMIATDTNYTFFTDSKDVGLMVSSHDGHGYALTFTMPAHDVTLSLEMRNSMIFDPGAIKPEPERRRKFIPDDYPTDPWFCPVCGRRNTTRFCADCGAQKPDWPDEENNTR